MALEAGRAVPVASYHEQADQRAAVADGRQCECADPGGLQVVRAVRDRPPSHRGDPGAVSCPPPDGLEECARRPGAGNVDLLMPARRDPVPQVTRAERDHASEADVFDLDEGIRQVLRLVLEALGRFQPRDGRDDPSAELDFSRQIALQRAFATHVTTDRHDVRYATGPVMDRGNDEVCHDSRSTRRDGSVRSRPRPAFSDRLRDRLVLRFVLARGRGNEEVPADDLGPWTGDMALGGEVRIDDPTSRIGDGDRIQPPGRSQRAGRPRRYRPRPGMGPMLEIAGRRGLRRTGRTEADGDAWTCRRMLPFERVEAARMRAAWVRQHGRTVRSSGRSVRSREHGEQLGLGVDAETFEGGREMVPDGRLRNEHLLGDQRYPLPGDEPT